MPDRSLQTHALNPGGRWLIWTVGLLLSAMFAVTLSLTGQVVSNLERQRSANSDNVQWTLTQVEVEYLSFVNELEQHLHDPDGLLPPAEDVSELRRKFDVFYSRVDTLHSSSLFLPLREDPDFKARLDVALAFLDRTVPAIDGDDATLFSEIVPIWQDARLVRDEVRGLSLEGLSYFATTSDARRDETATTLAQLAALSGALMLVLAVTSIYLLYINRIIRRRGDEMVETNQRMRTILSTSLDGVIVSNAAGEVLQFNPAAESIFGYKAEDTIGRSIGDLIVPPHLRDMHNAGMKRMQEGGERRVVGHGRVQLDAMRQNGDVFPAELALQSAQSGEEEIVIAFVRDISQRVDDQTELISARDKALAGEKAKAEFLTVMTHEIRTPLNGLLGNLSLLKNARPNKEQRQFVHNMELSGQVLLNHVDTVLDIARFEAGKLSVKREPIDLGLLLQEIVDSQSGYAASRGNAITWQWSGPAEPWVATDGQRLQQVLLNLVGNAIKFTERGRVSIELDVAEPADATGKAVYEFRVTDTGVGISEDDLERVFDDFHTHDASIGRAEGGTGLGLGIARRFAEAMGGEIGVESSLGEGSVFWVRLPLQQVDEAKPQARDPIHAGPLHKLDLLVVEDNEINLEVIRNMLEMDGHTVAIARNGEAGVEAAHTHRFDAILMDISMPVMDGPTATRHIRSEGGQSAASPILAVSANVLPQSVAEFRAAGMNAFVGKPLTLTSLRKALVALFDEEDGLTGEAEDIDPLTSMRADLGEEAFARFLERFRAEGDDMVARLERTGETKDALHDIAQESHRLAGSAAMFGALEMRDVLIEVEMAAKSGEQDELAALIRKTRGVWTRTQKALPKPD